MTDHKFTDDDAIKALECCKMPVGSGACNNCPFDYQRKKRLTGSDKSCTTLMFDYALALINRQKAEIERLNKEVDRLSQCVIYHDGIVSDLEKDVLDAKSEAIKEFAKKIKTDAERICDDNYIEGALIKYVDTLVEEMTETK